MMDVNLRGNLISLFIALNAACSIHVFLLARVKGMALAAYPYVDIFHGGAGVYHLPTGTTYDRIYVMRMNISFHGNNVGTMYQVDEPASSRNW
jgi:hypothetical protein